MEKYIAVKWGYSYENLVPFFINFPRLFNQLTLGTDLQTPISTLNSYYLMSKIISVDFIFCWFQYLQLGNPVEKPKAPEKVGETLVNIKNMGAKFISQFVLLDMID